jgi:hypothetical protein
LLRCGSRNLRRFAFTLRKLAFPVETRLAASPGAK